MMRFTRSIVRDKIFVSRDDGDGMCSKPVPTCHLCSSCSTWKRAGSRASEAQPHSLFMSSPPASVLHHAVAQ